MQSGTNAALEQRFDEGLRAHMSRTYSLIGLGLAASAGTASLIAFTALRDLVVTPEGGLTLLGTVGMWAPLILLLMAAFRLVGSTAASTATLYWAFTTLQGVGLSLTLLTVPPAAIVKALAVAAATFGAMSLYGYTTKRDLSAWRSFLLMGLFGLIAAMLVNIVLGSAAIEFAVSVAGVLVFSGLTAYDTQKLKDGYYSGLRGSDLDQLRYWAALGLYLNLLNLFHLFLGLSRD